MKKLTPNEIEDLLKTLENSSLDEDVIGLIKSLIAGQEYLLNFLIKIIDVKGPLRQKLIKELTKVLGIKNQTEASPPNPDPDSEESEKGNEKDESNEDGIIETDEPEEFEQEGDLDSDENDQSDLENTDDSESNGESKEEGDGNSHPQRGNDEYNPIEIFFHDHQNLSAGDICPTCHIGKVYPFREQIIPVIIGRSPLTYEEHRIQVYRCNACGEIFQPKLPEEIPKIGKASSSALALAPILHYEMGIAFRRISFLQNSFNQNLSPSQTWEICESAAGILKPVWEELKRQAANADVFYTDDTGVTILSCSAENKKNRLKKKSGKKKAPEDRVATYSSVIIGVLPCGNEVHLFFHGRKYAGENFLDILKLRNSELGAPIHMKDALSMNNPGDFEVLEVKCNAHALRKFKELIDLYPKECNFILEQYGVVYSNDEKYKELSDKERLLKHQTHSLPIMEKIKKSMEEFIDEKLVEPNSSLGGAIQYFLSHYKELIGFCKYEGAPLDNNKAERSLKLVIRLRKNSMFYKTKNGSNVAEILQSMIYTAEIFNENVYEYLFALFENQEAIRKNPKEWLPWT
jgi:hypothetical protein